MKFKKGDKVWFSIPGLNHKCNNSIVKIKTGKVLECDLSEKRIWVFSEKQKRSICPLLKDLSPASILIKMLYGED